MDCFTLENLSFAYPEQENCALKNVDLSIEKGDFIIVCGPSGCGKSTLLRQFKSVLTPHGKRNGSVLFFGKPLEDVSYREQSEKIGYVLQSPENQVVTDKVWHELAFLPESLGYGTAEIRKRVAEMAAFFGIENWFYKNVSELSGGQKQLLSLASVMTAKPEVLILDEPTAQLDPIAASEFLSVLGKLNRELGITVILTEHRLEEAFPFANRVAFMENGCIICCDSPKNVGMLLKEQNNGMFLAMPAAMRVWAALDGNGECPVTVREGSSFLAEYSAEHKHSEISNKITPISGETVLSAQNLFFRYSRDLPDVLKGFSFELHRGEFFALLGGNGVGKSTALKLLAGFLRPYRGTVTATGKIGVLPQDPATLFVKKTVEEELLSAFDGKKTEKSERLKRVYEAARFCGISDLLKRHPFDISGGEQQRAALARVLLCEPDILLLDEPTKGFDAEFKAEFAEILNRLLVGGTSVFMVSHDVSFCAEYAHRCGLLFDGEIVSSGTPTQFFSGNNFYTTPANRMARNIIPSAITANEIISAFGGKVQKNNTSESAAFSIKSVEESNVDNGKKKTGLPVWRKVSAVLFAFITVAAFSYAVKKTDLTSLINPSGIASSPKQQYIVYALLIISLFGLFFSVFRRSDAPIDAPNKKRLSRRTAAACLMILFFIPITVFIGVFYLDDRSYGLISLLVIAECMLPFLLVFEGKKPKARELVTVAALSAMGVAGRVAFFMLPQFKPVTAITVISGVALGGETGFMVGALSMLLSNMMFSQGPWTPWQMFCMGIIGFFAGILYRKGLLRRNRFSLAVFGALSCIIIYGGIINPASVLMWSPESLNFKTVVASYISGFPMDLIHASATALFLLFGADPMLEKLERVKTKYGLLE